MSGSNNNSTQLRYDRGRRRSQVMAALLSEVFAGHLRPGQHLVTQQLAERFAVSHTPIREALIALAGMGVLDWLPNRGAVVRSVGRREVEEICQVRRLLECAATRRACGGIGLVELERLRQTFLELQQVDVHRLTPRQARRFIDRARAADNALHDLIAASCGNSFLAQELERLKLLFRVFRDVAWQQEDARHDYRRLATEAGEHLAIVEALLRNDPRQAAQAMSAYIRSGARYWGRTLPANASDQPQNGQPARPRARHALHTNGSSKLSDVLPVGKAGSGQSTDTGSRRNGKLSRKAKPAGRPPA